MRRARAYLCSALVLGPSPHCHRLSGTPMAEAPRFVNIVCRGLCRNPRIPAGVGGVCWMSLGYK